MKKHILIIFALLLIDLTGFTQVESTKVDSTGVAPLLEIPIAMETTSVPSAFVDLSNNIAPPSPHAAEIGRFGAIPVGLFTGSMKYDISIYDLKNENLNLPVTLSYCSNGLQVDKLASWVGFDWSITAGGIINRYRKGKTDIPGTRPYSDWNSLTASEKINFLEMLQVSNNDLQPDIFVFSFSNYSGKFIFDENGDPKLIPYSPLKIETNTSGAYQFFHITTPDGIIYKFEDTDDTAPPSETSYSTAWHLSKIIHPTGDSITFLYTKKNLAQRVGINRNVTLNLPNGHDDPLGACNYNNSVKQVSVVNNSISYLNSIELHGKGKIVFEKTDNRTDSSFDYKLDKIRIEDVNNNQIKAVKLFYQFRLCNTFSNELSNDIDKRRMFLDSIQIIDANDIRIKSFGFEYNDINYLPPRFSYSQDHQNYFNGKSNNDIVSLDDVPSNYQGLFSNHVGSTVDRSSNYLYAKRGMINKIIYPTGGYTTISYEANKNNSNIEVGGCRVSQTKDFDSPTSIPIIKKYNYTNVQTSPTLIPTYYREYSTYFNYNWDFASYTGQCTYGILSSNSLSKLYIEGQNHVCYPVVEILYGENGENGKERHTFHIQYDAVCYPVNGGQIYPIQVSNDGWSSGVLQNLLLSNNTSAIKENQTNYNFNETRNQTDINCLAFQKRILPDYLPMNDMERLSYYDVVPFTLHSNWYYTSSEVVTNYESNGNINTTNTFLYENELHCQLTKKIITNSDAKVQQTQFAYPNDYNTTVENFNTLIGKNIITKPIDVRTYNGTQLISGTQTKYNNDGQPIDIYNAEVSAGADIVFSPTNPYTFTHKATLDYNTNKTIKQASPDDNITTTYLWDNTSNYLMAKIENATYLQVSSYDGQAYNTDSETLHDDLTTALQSTAPNAMITTFTHKPLVGIAQQTDPAGRTTYYEYDDFGRLQLVRDQNDNIINKYEYHYANE